MPPATWDTTNLFYDANGNMTSDGTHSYTWDARKLGWKQLGSRTQVLYTVEFTSSDDAKLGSSKGSCWDTKLEKCATQVVKDAKTAARKIRLTP